MQVSIGTRLCLICLGIQMEKQTTDVIFVLSPYAERGTYGIQKLSCLISTQISCAFYLPLALHHEAEESPSEFSVTLADPCLCHIAGE